MPFREQGLLLVDLLDDLVNALSQVLTLLDDRLASHLDCLNLPLHLLDVVLLFIRGRDSFPDFANCALQKWIRVVFDL